MLATDPHALHAFLALRRGGSGDGTDAGGGLGVGDAGASVASGSGRRMLSIVASRIFFYALLPPRDALLAANEVLLATIELEGAQQHARVHAVQPRHVRLRRPLAVRAQDGLQHVRDVLFKVLRVHLGLGVGHFFLESARGLKNLTGPPDRLGGRSF